MAARIAILGWGSLLWDLRPDFERWHEQWLLDGPIVPIEFSRVSISRAGALTLVIDSTNGVPNCVAYCKSKRESLNAVIKDLANREQTNKDNIGFLDRGHLHCPDIESMTSVVEWARSHGFESVAWTALSNNFVDKLGVPFSVEAAQLYLNSLDCNARKIAFEYIRKAPDFVQTPLRSAIM